MKQGETFDQTFVVTEGIYQVFTGVFNDRNPLHTDSNFARSKGFENCVMHGNILGGFLSYFIGECLPEKNVIIHSQEIKYLNPVYLNDQLEFRAEISEVFESVRAIEFKFQFRKGDLRIARGKIQIGLI